MALSEKDDSFTRVNLELQKAQVNQRILSVCDFAKIYFFILQDLLKTTETELRSAKVENPFLRL